MGFFPVFLRTLKRFEFNLNLYLVFMVYIVGIVPHVINEVYILYFTLSISMNQNSFKSGSVLCFETII